MLRKIFTGVALAASVVAIGLSAWVLIGPDGGAEHTSTVAGEAPQSGPPESSALWLPAPSLEVLVAKSSLIVVGSVSAVGERRTVESPALAAQRAAGKAPAFAETSVPFTMYWIDVSAYLKGSGPSRLLLAQFGEADSAEFPAPVVGAPTTFFLGPAGPSLPDAFATYGGPFGRTIFEDSAWRYLAAEHAVVPFLKGVGPEGLAPAIAALVPSARP